MPAAIEIRHVSKHFRLYHEHYSSLKERMIHFGRIPFEDFVALNDIELSIEEGTTVGILGHNGSGKSTLLKCVAGILQPNEGEIVTRGRLAALLELGAGFHPELTGRENIFMNASILGLSKRDITGVFDEIVAFAELEKFIDMQVRHYSSGMYIRLGFAVAVNVDPDILLVDEVLSVGDEAFQRKCVERVKKFQHEGRTILFVTHAADLVRRICDRGIVLDHGEMVADAPPGEAVRTFRETLQRLGPRRSDRRGRGGGDRSGRRPSGTAATSHGRRMAASGDAPGQDHQRRRSSIPGSLVGRTWLLPDEAMTIRVVVPRRRADRRPALRDRDPRRRGQQHLRHQHQDRRRHRAGGRRRRAGDVRFRARPVARRHLPRDARDPVDRRGHGPRLERPAVPVLGHEPGPHRRPRRRSPLQIRFGTPYAERRRGQRFLSTPPVVAIQGGPVARRRAEHALRAPGSTSPARSTSSSACSPTGSTPRPKRSR